MKRLLIAWDFFGVINAIEPRSLAATLQQLLDVGAEQIIVSHSSKNEIERYIELHQLKQFFMYIYGAEWHMAESGLGKAPALQDYIAQHGPFTKMYVVGDSLNDMADGRQAGMKAILFDANQHYTDVSAETDEVVTDISNVVSVIAGDAHD